MAERESGDDRQLEAVLGHERDSQCVGQVEPGPTRAKRVAEPALEIPGLAVCRALGVRPSTLLRRAEDASGLWGE